MFNTQFMISIRDINAGQHLDHLALLGYLHETRVQFLRSIGYAENNVDGYGGMLLVSKLSCKYIKECFCGEIINVQLELHKESELRLVCRYIVTRESITVAAAEIAVAFIDSNKKLIHVPANLLSSQT